MSAPTGKLDVVRKLLTKAARAATAEEADAYTLKAMQLAARHGIDTALLAADDDAAPDPIDATRVPIVGAYSTGKARLLGWTAEALGCKAVLRMPEGGRSVIAVTLFGHASDRERAVLLYTSLLLQVEVGLRRARPTPRTVPRGYRVESVAAYRRSWLHGFALRVHARLVAAQAAAATTAAAETDAAGHTLAVVLADRATAVEAAYADAFSGIGTARSARLSGSGFADGSRAADRARLGIDPGVGAGQARAALHA